MAVASVTGGEAGGSEAAPATSAGGPHAAEPFVFSCEMAVRDYELDQYSVVNNAIFANYLQHVRHEFLTHVGVSADAVARQGDALAISELNMRYLRPLRSGDRFRGTCRVVKATAARLVFEQQLWLQPWRRHAHPAPNGSKEEHRDEEELLVLSAEAVVVSLDSSYKPKRINARLRELLLTGAPAGELLQLQELL